MKLEDLLVVSFDGLNRSGKGTQIGLLKDYLESRNFQVEVLRGDGSRPGIGSTSFYDPASNFWQNWQKKENKSIDDWIYASRILSYENYLKCIEFSAEVKEKDQAGAILLDRSHISTWYMLRKKDPNTPFVDSLKEPTVLPDIYFNLSVPKETLLARNSDDNPDKAEFRKRVVSTSYDKWTSTMRMVPKDIEMYVMDGTQDKEYINCQVINVVETKLSIYNENDGDELYGIKE